MHELLKFHAHVLLPRANCKLCFMESVSSMYFKLCFMESSFINVFWIFVLSFFSFTLLNMCMN